MGFDYFRRTATTQECGGPLQRITAVRKNNNSFVLNAEAPNTNKRYLAQLHSANNVHTFNVSDQDTDVKNITLQSKLNITKPIIVRPLLPFLSSSIRRRQPVSKSSNVFTFFTVFI